ALVRLRKIVQLLTALLVIHNSAHRYFQDNALTIAAGAVGALAVASALGVIFRIEAEVDQRVVALAGLHDHVATASAIATGWAAARDKLLPAEGHAAVSAPARFHPDYCLVNKHESQQQAPHRAGLNLPTWTCSHQCTTLSFH